MTARSASAPATRLPAEFAGPFGTERIRTHLTLALARRLVADHHVYVIECADGTLYTGYTTDVERRVAEHDAGEGAKYTRGRTPVTLRHVESFGSKSAAMSREHAIKSLSRAQKEQLIDGDDD
ncbi:hypothetical protein GCM10008994_17740 [Halorubrum ejinorense]|uniref:GIY-YIG domain-containing protein n=1 Tax=Halorubrum ejinorense TaxID=425309 RepID=A0AAV3SSA3_9EURY